MAAMTMEIAISCVSKVKASMIKEAAKRSRILDKGILDLFVISWFLTLAYYDQNIPFLQFGEVSLHFAFLLSFLVR